MGMTTVTEPVYENTPDGRTILAAAPGDELDEREAKRLGIGKDGTSSNGVTPPDSMEAQRAIGAAAQSGDFDAPVVADQNDASSSSSSSPADPSNPLDGLNAKDSVKAIAGMDAETLAAAQAAENGREGGARASVQKALDSRNETLTAEAEAAASSTEDGS